MPEDVIATIVTKNGWTFSPPIINPNGMPNNMPDGYFIDCISQGLTVADMAQELNCSRDSIYKLLRRRNISVDAYRPANLKTIHTRPKAKEE